MKTVLVQTSDRNYCAWVLQPSLYWKWLKKPTGWQCNGEKRPQHGVLNYQIVRYPAGIQTCIFELGQWSVWIREAWRRSPVKGSLDWQRDKGSRTAKCVQRNSSVLGTGWENLDANLKQYLYPLTCFSSKQIITGFQVIFWVPPVSPSGGLARQIQCGKPWWWLGAIGSGDYLREG